MLRFHMLKAGLAELSSNEMNPKVTATLFGWLLLFGANHFSGRRLLRLHSVSAMASRITAPATAAMPSQVTYGCIAPELAAPTSAATSAGVAADGLSEFASAAIIVGAGVAEGGSAAISPVEALDSVGDSFFADGFSDSDAAAMLVGAF